MLTSRIFCLRLRLSWPQRPRFRRSSDACAPRARRRQRQRRYTRRKRKRHTGSEFQCSWCLFLRVYFGSDVVVLLDALLRSGEVSFVGLLVKFFVCDDFSGVHGSSRRTSGGRSGISVTGATTLTSGRLVEQPDSSHRDRASWKMNCRKSLLRCVIVLPRYLDLILKTAGAYIGCAL